AAVSAGEVVAAATAAAASPSAPASPAAGLDADRFQALLSLVALRRERGESGGALTALRRVAALPLDAAQRDAVRRLTDAVARELELACDEVMGLLHAGRGLTARDRVQALDAEDGAAAAAALAARLARSPEGLVGVPAPGDLPWPVAAPLARDRTVHARLPGGFAIGRIVAARADGLTLRVETAAGVTFPSVAMAAVEPAEPTAAEAVELALAALHAGDGLLARLWLACADLRGGASPRQERVRRLLA
ncbi:MAG: hypothetical protein KF830_17885, partial [Planctomycetes bacterium]|nr:hypothetical protein [Planctomycetota bacterium]